MGRAGERRRDECFVRRVREDACSSLSLGGNYGQQDAPEENEMRIASSTFATLQMAQIR
jgi:hypothetical protein